MLSVTLDKASDLFGYHFSHRQTCLDEIHAFQGGPLGLALESGGLW